jgi:hypothetical protein
MRKYCVPALFSILLLGACLSPLLLPVSRGQDSTSTARRIRETSGPTTLTVGSVSDGQFLKRVGSTVVGAAAGGTTLTDSASLRSALSDETGTGAAVFAGGNIGAATATSINGNTFTAGTYTLTGAAGKTFTFNNTLTLAGTDSTTVNLGTVLATTYGAGIQVSGGGTIYGVPPSVTLSSTESQRQIVAPQAGTIKNLYVGTISTQSVNNSLVLTVRTCTPVTGACTGSNSTVTVTFAAGQTATVLSDTTHTVSVAAGDLISVGIVNNANVSSANIGTISFVIQ